MKNVKNKLNFVSVDVEADGPIPGKFSMISLGAVVAEPPYDDSFYVTIAPITKEFIPDALKVTGFTRQQTENFNKPEVEMLRFNEWLKDLKLRKGQPIFVSDNNGFDWQFINYYLHFYIGKNEFGFSSLNLNSLYKGVSRSMQAKFKEHRVTKHTHNALDDAKGNAEALYTILNKYEIKC